MIIVNYGLGAPTRRVRPDRRGWSEIPHDDATAGGIDLLTSSSNPLWLVSQRPVACKIFMRAAKSITKQRGSPQSSQFGFHCVIPKQAGEHQRRQSTIVGRVHIYPLIDEDSYAQDRSGLHGRMQRRPPFIANVAGRSRRCRHVQPETGIRTEGARIPHQ